MTSVTVLNITSIIIYKKKKKLRELVVKMDPLINQVERGHLVCGQDDTRIRIICSIYLRHVHNAVFSHYRGSSMAKHTLNKPFVLLVG